MTADRSATPPEPRPPDTPPVVWLLDGEEWTFRYAESPTSRDWTHSTRLPGAFYNAKGTRLSLLGTRQLELIAELLSRPGAEARPMTPPEPSAQAREVAREVLKSCGWTFCPAPGFEVIRGYVTDAEARDVWEKVARALTAFAAARSALGAP